MRYRQLVKLQRGSRTQLQHHQHQSATIQQFVTSLRRGRRSCYQYPSKPSTPTNQHMDSSLHEVWRASAGSPFFPVVNKGSQFWIAFLLLLLGVIVTGVFALNRSLVNVPVLGIPASLAIAFGTVYMFCAVGVYV